MSTAIVFTDGTSLVVDQDVATAVDTVQCAMFRAAPTGHGALPSLTVDGTEFHLVPTGVRYLVAASALPPSTTPLPRETR